MTEAAAAAPDALLWSPLDIGPMRVRHRVMMTGHTLLYGEAGHLSQRHIDYYRERAAGGVALIVTEQQAAHPSGANYLQGCRAYDPSSVLWYRRLADAVHAHDTRVLVQLFCGGAQGSGTLYIDEWRPLWAPSSIASTQFHEQPAVMGEDEVRDVIAGFALSARHAEAGGCDGVEIHAAHSQLLGSFLSPAFNRRTDRYGGSIENRCRIVLDIGEAVRRATGARFAVGLRLSIEERLANDAGIREAEFHRQLEIFAQSGLFDFYDLSAGGYFAKHISVTAMTTDLPDAFLAPASARAKQIVGTRGRIFVVGRVFEPAVADRVIASGAADMVAMTRAQMADPELVAKARSGRQDEIVRCVNANVCVRRLGENNAIVCAMNPALGREATLGHGTLRRAVKAKRIVVLGAGPAGLRFAGTAAARGHSVLVLDRADAPGGRMRWLATLPGRERWHDGTSNLMRRIESGRVELRLSTSLSRQQLEALGAELIVLAIGARYETSGYSAYRPDRAGIPGIESERVVGIDTAIERVGLDPSRLGRRVTIIDDGSDELTAGLAEKLARAGAAVHIITPRSWWGEGLSRTYDYAHVMPRLVAGGVSVQPQRFVERITANGIETYDLWQPQKVEVAAADTIVLALGREPLPAPADLPAVAAERIGDNLAPRSIEAVIFEGEALARRI